MLCHLISNCNRFERQWAKKVCIFMDPHPPFSFFVKKSIFVVMLKTGEYNGPPPGTCRTRFVLVTSTSFPKSATQQPERDILWNLDGKAKRLVLREWGSGDRRKAKGQVQGLPQPSSLLVALKNCYGIYRCSPVQHSALPEPVTVKSALTTSLNSVRNNQISAKHKLSCFFVF